MPSTMHMGHSNEPSRFGLLVFPLDSGISLLSATHAHVARPYIMDPFSFRNDVYERHLGAPYSYIYMFRMCMYAIRLVTSTLYLPI